MAELDNRYAAARDLHCILLVLGRLLVLIELLNEFIHNSVNMIINIVQIYLELY